VGEFPKRLFQWPVGGKTQAFVLSPRIAFVDRLQISLPFRLGACAHIWQTNSLLSKRNAT
jgi:hypothetical protein